MSETLAERELQRLLVVALARLDGLRQADDNRTHRGLPSQGNAGGRAQAVGVEIVEVAIDVADIDKQRQTRTADFDEWNGEGQLNASGNLQVTADRATERIFGSEGVVVEAAHIGDAAGKKCS